MKQARSCVLKVHAKSVKGNSVFKRGITLLHESTFVHESRYKRGWLRGIDVSKHVRKENFPFNIQICAAWITIKLGLDFERMKEAATSPTVFRTRLP